MIVEWYALKYFGLGVFITWYALRRLSIYRKPKTYEIKEI